MTGFSLRKGKITQLLAQFPALKAAEAQLADAQRNLSETKIALKVRIDLHEETKAKLSESRQKAKNYEEVAHGLSSEVDALKAQLAELRGQEPHTYVLFDGDDVEYNSTDEFSCGRTGGTPLYAHPVPPAASQPVANDEAAHVASILEYIGNTESDDIEGDSVDLRFEVDGVDTGSDASITEYALRGAEVIRKLLASQPYTVPDEATPDGIVMMASTYAPRGVTYFWDAAECNAAADSWNACRAAMLQSQPVSKPDRLPVNSVTAEHQRVIEMLLKVCGAAFELADDTCEQDVDGEQCHVVPHDAFQKLSDTLDEIENSLPTEDADRPDVFLAWAAMPRAALKSILQSGNSPVVPDGWVTVPVEPTEAMLLVLGMTGSFDSMIAKYQKMLAVAPRKEE